MSGDDLITRLEDRTARLARAREGYLREREDRRRREAEAQDRKFKLLAQNRYRLRAMEVELGRDPGEGVPRGWVETSVTAPTGELFATAAPVAVASIDGDLVSFDHFRARASAAWGIDLELVGRLASSSVLARLILAVIETPLPLDLWPLLGEAADHLQEVTS